MYSFTLYSVYTVIYPLHSQITTQRALERFRRIAHYSNSNVCIVFVLGHFIRIIIILLTVNPSRMEEAPKGDPDGNAVGEKSQRLDEGPNYKDQAREARGTPGTIPAVTNPLLPPLSRIDIVQGLPDYKDQARNPPPVPDCFSAISDFSLTNSGFVAAPIWNSPNIDDYDDDPELVSAHIVTETVADQDPPDAPPVYLNAEVVDTKQEHRRLLVNVSLIVMGILLIVLVPTFVLTLSDSQSVPSMVATNSTTPSIVTSSPISPSPSAAPSESDRYVLLGEILDTDLPVGRPAMASLSSNGTVVAVANNDTIQVYQQQQVASGEISWFPLGSALPAVTEYVLYPDKYYTMFLAAEALVLAVGMPSFLNGAGRVDVYEYIADRWVLRGESFVGNSTHQLGYDVVLSTDGSLLVMAASRYTAGELGIGYAEVQSWNTTSSAWQLIGRIHGFESSISVSIALAGPQDGSQKFLVVLWDSEINLVAIMSVHECSINEGCTFLENQHQGPFFDVSFSRNGDFFAIGNPGFLSCTDTCANVRVYLHGDQPEPWRLIGQELLGVSGYGDKVKLSQSGGTLAVFSLNPVLSESSWTQLYHLENGVWIVAGPPLYGDFLDMSDHGNVVATRFNGEIILQTLISYDVSNNVS